MQHQIGQKTFHRAAMVEIVEAEYMRMIGQSEQFAKTVFKRTKDLSQEVSWVLKGVAFNNVSGSAARRVHSKCPTLAYFNEK